MPTLISLILSTITVFVTASILPGIHLAGFWTALVVAVVLAILNTFIRPLLLIITLPITLLTFGLFALVILALMILIVSWIVPGFEVDGFWWALAFALVLSLINWAVDAAFKPD